jgi:hypothetical protein
MRRALYIVLALANLAVVVYASDYLDRTTKLPITLEELGYRYLALAAYVVGIVGGLAVSIEIIKINNNDNTTDTTGV